MEYRAVAIVLSVGRYGPQAVGFDVSAEELNLIQGNFRLKENAASVDSMLAARKEQIEQEE
jgi:hypothetical protein